VPWVKELVRHPWLTGKTVRGGHAAGCSVRVGEFLNVRNREARPVFNYRRVLRQSVFVGTLPVLVGVSSSLVYFDVLNGLSISFWISPANNLRELLVS
jgi:hypothetical protein